MDRIMVVAAIGAALVFAAGCVLGIIVMIALAVRREDRGHTLTGEPPDLATRGARRLTGLGVRRIPPPGDEQQAAVLDEQAAVLEQQGATQDEEPTLPPWWHARVD